MMRKTTLFILIAATILLTGCGDNSGSLLAPYMMTSYIPQSTGKGDIKGRVTASFFMGSSQEVSLINPTGYVEVDGKLAFFEPSNKNFYINDISIGFHNISIYTYGYQKFSAQFQIFEDTRTGYVFHIKKPNEALSEVYTASVEASTKDEEGNTVIQLESFEEPLPNYYSNIVEINEPYFSIRRFTRKPILVYLDTVNVPPDWNSDYYSHAVNGFGVWEEACTELQFELIDERERADVSITWKSSIIDPYAEDTTEGGILGMTYSNDPMYPDFPGLKVLIELGVSPDSYSMNDDLRFAVAIHEIGHALGLWGHSPNNTDMMYPYAWRQPFEKMPITELSQADINTINMLYQIIPTWTNLATSNALSEYKNKSKPSARTIQ